MTSYALGVDFGTESGRAVLVDVADGREVAPPSTAMPTASSTNGCRDDDVRLGAGLGAAGPRRLPATSSSRPCRPCWRRRGRPGRRDRRRHRLHRLHHAAHARPTARRSATLPDWRRNPHAWVKLWKHHAAQPEADRINEIGAATGEAWLHRYGGKISSEWFCSQGAADPRRGARGLRRRRPPDRGRRLGHLAADRRRDAQLLHRRLQGHLVQARGLSRAATTSRRWTRAWPTSVDDKMSRDDLPARRHAPAG